MRWRPGSARTLHVLYRWGEPGENPYLGFLASADAVVVTADSVSMISEACATTAPVFVALPELAGPRHRRLIATLHRAGHVRLLGDDLSPWPRARWTRPAGWRPKSGGAFALRLSGRARA